MSELRAEILEWTAALRSGKYPKGTSTCRSKDDKFCCLGIKNELEPGVHKLLIEGRYYYSMFPFEVDKPVDEYTCTSAVLLQETAKRLNIDVWAYFRLRKAYRDWPAGYASGLTTINDSDNGRKYTFNDIADLIEEIERQQAWAAYSEPECSSM